ncbi:MAG: cation:proton antiporter [Thermoleophilia bacterium]
MNFAQLGLICAVAIAGPLLSLPRWLHLPVVVGELAVGLALGATGLRVLHADDPVFAFLAQAGFALVMFVAGSHVPMRDRALRAGLRSGLLRAVAVGVLAGGAGVGIAHAFGNHHGPLYAVLIASSSAGLVMPALSGVPLTAPAVVAMLPQIAVADAASIVALPLAIDPRHAPRAAVGAVVVAVAALLVWGVYRWAERSGRRKLVHTTSEERKLALELRVMLAVLFGMAGLAQHVHVSVMLAGFSLGLGVSAVGEPRRLAKQLFALTEGFFGPIFFVWLGTSLDLRDLIDHPSAVILGVVLGVAAVAVHGVMGLTGQPWPLAAITASQLGVPVAAAALGSQLGVLAPGESTALLLGALVTIAVTAGLTGRVTAIAIAGAPPQAKAKAGGGTAHAS